jgi:hypothetical protein
MQRWTALLFVLLVTGTVVLVVTEGGKHPAPTKPAATASDAGAPSASASAPAASASAAAADEPVDLDAGDLTEPSGDTVEHVDAGGTVLLTGEAPPPLPAGAPKTVTWGVVLVTYRGAQGAPATARPRDAALSMAKEIAELAKTDFKAAVAKGDKGSLENAGKMPRGVLEPAPEYVLFSLEKGDVGGPVDTPRGFWIVRRIE